MSADQPTTWSRWRFHIAHDNPHPVEFPPAGPYWVTTHIGRLVDDKGHSIVIAYLPSDLPVTDPKHWPDAIDIVLLDTTDTIVYADRFPQHTDWFDLWKENGGRYDKPSWVDY